MGYNSNRPTSSGFSRAFSAEDEFREARAVCARLNLDFNCRDWWREAVVLWVILTFNLLTILIAFRKRALLYALHNAIFTYLVTGQAFQIRADLDRSHTVFYLLNFISDVGFHTAVWYVFGVSLVSFLLAVVSKVYVPTSQPEKRFLFDPTRGFYFWLFVFLCAASVVLIFEVIGLDEFLHSSRPGFQSGSAIFVVLLFLGIVPVLLKIIYPGKIGFGDIVCFLPTFVVTGFLSRFHLILYLVSTLMALYYARGWVCRPHTIGLLAKVSLFGLGAGCIFFGIGALHDAQNYTHGSLGDLISYIVENPEKTLLSVEYNYRVGIEGMSGTAGAFSHYYGDPYTVHFDYGASWVLQGAAQWLPGFLKSYASSISELGESLNWHSDSIIPPGIESFYVSFGWFGVLLYPLASYLLAWRMPTALYSDRVSPRSKLVLYMVAALTISFVRGSLVVWIAFTVSYVTLIVVLWPVFRRQMKPKRATPVLDSKESCRARTT